MTDPIGKRASLIAKTGCLLLAAAAVAYVYFAHDVRLKYFIMGSGSWGFGVLLKMLLHALVMKRIPKEKLATPMVALLNGFVSGLTELGLAVIFFVYLGELTFWQVIAFGAGIGAIEAWVVATTPNLLKGTILEEGSNALEAKVASLPDSQRLFWEGAVPIYERLLALVTHIATRGLVYVTIRTLNFIPLELALIVFIVLDGYVAFRVLMYSGPEQLDRLKGVFRWWSVIVICAAILFGVFWTTIPASA